MFPKDESNGESKVKIVADQLNLIERRLVLCGSTLALSSLFIISKGMTIDDDELVSPGVVVIPPFDFQSAPSAFFLVAPAVLIFLLALALFYSGRYIRLIQELNTGQGWVVGVSAFRVFPCLLAAPVNSAGTVATEGLIRLLVFLATVLAPVVAVFISLYQFAKLHQSLAVVSLLSVAVLLPYLLSNSFEIWFSARHRFSRHFLSVLPAVYLFILAINLVMIDVSPLHIANQINTVERLSPIAARLIVPYLDIDLSKSSLTEHGSEFDSPLLRTNQREFQFARLRNMTLSGPVLFSFQFKYARLAGVDFRAKRLSKFKFEHSELVNVSFLQVEAIDDVEFKYSEIKNLSLPLVLTNVKISDSSMRNVQMMAATVDELSIRNTELTSFDASQANLIAPLFDRVTIRGSQFVGTTIIRPIIAKVDIADTNFSLSSFIGEKRKQHTGVKLASFKNIPFNWATFRNFIIESSSLENSYFFGACFYNTSVRNSSLLRNVFFETHFEHGPLGAFTGTFVWESASLFNYGFDDLIGSATLAVRQNNDYSSSEYSRLMNMANRDSIAFQSDLEFATTCNQSNCRKYFYDRWRDSEPDRREKNLWRDSKPHCPARESSLAIRNSKTGFATLYELINARSSQICSDENVARNLRDYLKVAPFGMKSVRVVNKPGPRETVSTMREDSEFLEEDLLNLLVTTINEKCPQKRVKFPSR